MQSLRQAISDIINDLKAYNLDDKYSYRFLAEKLKGNVETFLKQDAMDRTILKLNELWKPLLKIELSDSYLYPYNRYHDSEIIKKSIKKIPQVYTCKYGNLLKILNLNNSIEYIPTKPFAYMDIKNREIKNSKVRYYWIEDDYLYIPDASTEEVKGYGLFKNSQEADNFNGKVDECYKPLDSILLVPDYILKISKSQVVQELLVETQKVEDSNPNLNQNEK